MTGDATAPGNTCSCSPARCRPHSRSPPQWLLLQHQPVIGISIMLQYYCNGRLRLSARKPSSHSAAKYHF